MVYYCVLNGDKEVLIKGRHSEVLYTGTFNPIQIRDLNGTLKLSMRLAKFSLWNRTSWLKYIGELVQETSINFTLRPIKFFGGYWRFYVGTEVLDVYCYTGYYTALFSNGIKIGTIDIDDSYNTVTGTLIIRFKDEKYALLIVAFLMSAYLMEGPEGRDPAWSFNFYSPKNRPPR